VLSYPLCRWDLKAFESMEPKPKERHSLAIWFSDSL
jgi:hypothetical protein